MSQDMNTKQPSDPSLPYEFCSTDPHPQYPTPHSPFPPMRFPWARQVTITYQGLNV